MEAPEFSARGGVLKARALFGARLPMLLDKLNKCAGRVIYIIDRYHHFGGMA